MKALTCLAFLVGLVAVVGLGVTSANASSTYSVDNGTVSTGLADSSDDDFLLNGFTVIPGSNLITDIKVAIGCDGFNGNMSGHQITLAVWQDGPSQTGNPGDAGTSLVTSFTSTITNLMTNIGNTVPVWNTYTLPTPVAVTGKFFVGYMISISPDDAAANGAGGVTISDSDSGTPDNGQSWLVSANYGTGADYYNNLGGTGFIINLDNLDTLGSGFPPSQNLMIEADAVPEPVTLIAVGLGIAGLGGYVRRRVKVAE